VSESIEIEIGGQPAEEPTAPAAEAAPKPRRAARAKKAAADATQPAEAAPKPRRARKQPAAEEVGVRVAQRPAAPPAEAVGVRVAQRPATPPTPAATFWGANPSENFYEVELEVRNQASQQEGQSAEMGNVAAGLLKLIGENMRRMTEEQVNKVGQMLVGTDLNDYLDPNFWQGIGMVLQYQVKEQVAFVQRRLRGEYSVDPYGMDQDMIDAVRPFLSFMYRTWWRVTSHGLEHVPAEGRALLVSNHSGVLPWDGAMISTAVAAEHPTRPDRNVRSLHLHWFSTLPFVAPALAATGQVPGLPENAVRLLENDELVCVFPEGLKGVGKLYKDRYKLARFGRGGFVQAALRARAPIVPVAVVGAEEIYPMLYNAESFAKMLGFPYFPLTPFFPWLGLLGTIPLPTRWSITFCPPISTEEYGPRAADDPLTVLALAEQVRDTIQETINARLAERTSPF
jgi:1-acyl-sn-glycerol-3-phosphate acyltransferase